jgi:hypothetical protein
MVSQAACVLDAFSVFVATFVIAGGVYFCITRLAETEWARAFKAVSPGVLPVLGVLFALLVGFIAVEVWNSYDRAKSAVATEASALRAVVLLARNFPDEQRTRIEALINRHIEEAVNKEWPEMAQQRETLSTLPTALIEELHGMLVMHPADASQRTVQSEMIRALHTALEARRQRIVISESSVGAVKWGGDFASGTLHPGRHRNGSQRQSACLRHNADPFCDRRCAIGAADSRV